MNQACCTPKSQSRASTAEYTRPGPVYEPLVDIVERAEELLLVADVPGVAVDTIDIRFEDGQLSIHGSVAARYTGTGRWVQREYGIGDYHRTFRVGQRIDANKIHATYEAGVLTVHLPKIEAVKPRKINVQVAS